VIAPATLGEAPWDSAGAWVSLLPVVHQFVWDYLNPPFFSSAAVALRAYTQRRRFLTSQRVCGQQLPIQRRAHATWEQFRCQPSAAGNGQLRPNELGSSVVVSFARDRPSQEQGFLQNGTRILRV